MKEEKRRQQRFIDDRNAYAYYMRIPNLPSFSTQFGDRSTYDQELAHLISCSSPYHGSA